MTTEEFFLLHREICRRWQSLPGIETGKLPGVRMLQLCCYIGGHSGCSLNEAAFFAEITPGAASMLVDALCGKGILKRTLDSGDRRRIRLFLSPETRRFLEEIEEEINRNVLK